MGKIILRDAFLVKSKLCGVRKYCGGLCFYIEGKVYEYSIKEECFRNEAYDLIFNNLDNNEDVNLSLYR
jgi:hypothetical protein